MAGLDRVELVDTFDKSAVRAPEAVHVAFPLNVPGAEVRYDLAFGLCRTEVDQLPGANRNHLTVAYGADVSNQDFGVTLACPDAPLLEVGRLRADPIVTGWDTQLEPSSTLYGYVMNNYWETNYRAEQPGLVSLRYQLAPHGARDAVASRRFAVAARRPLLVAAAADGRPVAVVLPLPERAGNRGRGPAPRGPRRAHDAAQCGRGAGTRDLDDRAGAGASLRSGWRPARAAGRRPRAAGARVAQPRGGAAVVVTRVQTTERRFP